MNGRGSKQKGNRFERAVSAAWAKAFECNIRRTPASGGHIIRADIYDPERDCFPYFIECKHREDIRLESVMNGTAELYKYAIRNEDFAHESHFALKYGVIPVPVVIFKGGPFKEAMVLFRGTWMDRVKNPMFGLTKCKVYIRIRLGDIWVIVDQKSFLAWCNKKRLTELRQKAKR